MNSNIHHEFPAPLACDTLVPSLVQEKYETDLTKGARNSWWMLEFMCIFTQDLMMCFGRAMRDFALPPPPSVPLPSSPPLQNKNHHCTGKTHSLQKTKAIRISSPFWKIDPLGCIFRPLFAKRGGARDRRPPPLTAYARGIGLVQVILVLSFFHFCLKLSFVKSNRIILTETHVHKIPPPLSKVRPIHKQLLLFVSPGIQTWLYNSNANRILHIVITVNGRPIPKRSIMAIVEAPCSDKVKIDG